MTEAAQPPLERNHTACRALSVEGLKHRDQGEFPSRLCSGAQRRCEYAQDECHEERNGAIPHQPSRESVLCRPCSLHLKPNTQDHPRPKAVG